jgi:hypothetical protein
MELPNFQRGWRQPPFFLRQAEPEDRDTKQASSMELEEAEDVATMDKAVNTLTDKFRGALLEE